MRVILSFLGHPPNGFHDWVADRLREGTFPAVATTNFDRNVEAALERKGLVLCELTGDADRDRVLLEEQIGRGQPINPVLVPSFGAFAVVNDFLSLVGRPSHCFIFKVGLSFLS